MTRENAPQPTDDIIRPEVNVAEADSETEGQQGSISPLIVARSHRGPLPPIEELEGYDHLSPGSAKRMIDNVVRRSELRTEEEQKSATFRRFLEPFYRILAFAAVCVIVYFGYRLAQQGATLVGFAFVVIAAGTIAGSFILNARETRRETRLIERLMTTIQSETTDKENDE